MSPIQAATPVWCVVRRAAVKSEAYQMGGRGAVFKTTSALSRSSDSASDVLCKCACDSWSVNQLECGASCACATRQGTVFDRIPAIPVQIASPGRGRMVFNVRRFLLNQPRFKQFMAGLRNCQSVLWKHGFWVDWSFGELIQHATRHSCNCNYFDLFKCAILQLNSSGSCMITLQIVWTFFSTFSLSL